MYEDSALLIDGYLDSYTPLLKMTTLRHNRFQNNNAIVQVLARVETIVRGFLNGVDHGTLQRVLPQIYAQIRRIWRFLPRTLYLELIQRLRGLRLSTLGAPNRSLQRYRSSLLRVGKCC